ncbi:STT3 domain-containing protein [Methanothermococcus okinawensis]|uniref:dolichyl-phosphooligosaccharide-protein glycotransferase n=1 Tax=Methanothermococcus okinawensis (strain DSM 14208 / JCM 11175 / IH1) TaxID=647113 RepID=F8AM81_METOI|nr:STT3 domain-containing protein [Methanothermococcus okinawensis]AEH06768.1 Oligosaccharyl transferase STT3 subunit [Methanothermococcus okinawensis IH1]
MGNLINKISELFNKHKYIKLFLIVLVIGLISFQLRAQPADMGFTDNPQLKSMFADEHGRMYLVALDPYYYLRLTENYYYHGYLGETLKEVNGKLVPYDTCQYAPPGHPITEPVPVICLTTIAIYDIWHSYDATVTLMNAAYWVPAIMGILLGIPVFFIVRRTTLSNIGGIVGALTIISSPALLYKTSAGFADTPIFEVLPILFIVWFIMEAIHHQENLKKSLIFATLATIVMALAPRMWAGWWYGYDIVSGFLVIYLIYSYIIKNSYKKTVVVEVGNIKNILSIIGIFTAGGVLLISAIYGINNFINGALAPIGFTTIKAVSHASGWPNVYTTVSELATPSINDIISGSLGNAYLFVLGIIGALLSFISMRYKEMSIKFDAKYAILLTLWLFATFYAATKGVRFIGLMVPPLSIGVGIFAGQMANIIKRRNDDLTKWTLYPIIGILFLVALKITAQKIPKILIPTTYVPIAEYIMILTIAILAVYKIIDIISSNKEMQIKKTISILLALTLVLPPLANAVPLSSAPTLNNGWLESLNWIKTETPNNSVITCWWDNGHIYTWATRKMVTFDGGSQNSPRAYWVGRAFSTSDENLSIGILRMLATSGDSAFEENSILMNKTNHSVAKTVKILNEILPLDRTDAYTVLTNKYGLTGKEAYNVLNATHPEHPNPDYLITYNRMTDIAPVWSMFGMWNFNLSPNTPDDKREKGYYQKLRGEGFLTNGTLVIRVPLQKTKDYMVMNLIMVKNSTMASYDITYNTKTNTLISENITGFHKVIVKDENNIYEDTYNKNGVMSEIVRLEPVGNGQYYAYVWISTRNLEDSVYTKLHFLDGYGLKHIKLVKASLDPTNYGIQPGFKVYKVDYGNKYLN